VQVGEKIATGGLADEVKCPFNDPTQGVDQVESENLPMDDTIAVEIQQDNDGGVLGRNLASGSNGARGTVGGPYPPPKSRKVTRTDTRRGGVRVRVPATDDIPEGTFGFTVAAHHLIPGEASLAPSEVKSYMTKGDSVKVKTRAGVKTKKLRKHIGYNVNGAHNGVWLPGNYFIRASNSPVANTTWSALADNPWCLNYVAAVAKVARGQFHDAHTQYSSSVKKLLNKIAEILSQHECDECKPSDINPPFHVKGRLYALSSYFRTQVTASPGGWKRPWFTSDRWRDDAFAGGKPSSKFLTAYREARKATNPTASA